MKKIIAFTILSLFISIGFAQGITGKFDVNCETHTMVLFLVHTDKKVVGTYDIPLASGNVGHIEGILQDNRLDFELYEAFYEQNKKIKTGKGTLVFSNDHKSFSGSVTTTYTPEQGQAITSTSKWKGTWLD